MVREIIKIDEEKCNGCGGIVGAVIETGDKTLPDIKVDVHTIGIKGDIHWDTA